MSKPKNSKDALEFIHTLDSLAIKKQQEEIERLCAWGRGLESDLSHARVEISFLKAEVERLDTLCKQLSKQHSDISCENIMLRKAGDAMAKGLLKYIEPTDGYLTYLECRANWNAAKEGKPSV
jgi:hypothetical protein